MAKSYDNLSRAVSHALRHEPWIYELELDQEGWADVGALLTALGQIRGTLVNGINLSQANHKSAP
jgi:putative RNA 2'-phosphotransferase